MKKLFLAALFFSLVLPVSAQAFRARVPLDQGGPGRIACGLFTECADCRAVVEGTFSADMGINRLDALPKCQVACVNKCEEKKPKLICRGRSDLSRFCTNTLDLSRVNENQKWKAFIEVLEKDNVTPISCRRSRECQQCLFDLAEAAGARGTHAPPGKSSHVNGIACNFAYRDLAKVQARLFLLEGTPHGTYVYGQWLGVTVSSKPRPVR